MTGREQSDGSESPASSVDDMPTYPEAAAPVARQEGAGREKKFLPVLVSPQTELPYAEQFRLAFANNTLIEVLSAGAVVVSGACFALETLPGLSDVQNLVLIGSERVICVAFAVEFLMRWYASSLRSSFLLSPLALLDLLSFMPQLVGLIIDDPLNMGSGLGALRLLRVLRLQRFIVDAETFNRFQLALGVPPATVRPYQLQVARVLFSVLTLLFVATGLIYEAEHTVNPMIPDYFTALYFGLTTLTTVGFGDITPITFAGRLVVCGSIVAGVAIVPVQLASLGEALLQAAAEGPPQPRSAVNSAAAPSPSPSPAPPLLFSRMSIIKAQGAALAKRDRGGGGSGDIGDGSGGASGSGSIGRSGGSLDGECGVCGEAAHLRLAVFCHQCGNRL